MQWINRMYLSPDHAELNYKEVLKKSYKIEQFDSSCPRNYATRSVNINIKVSVINLSYIFYGMCRPTD